MSAAQRIEATDFFAGSSTDRFTPESGTCDCWRELTLPLPLPEAQVAALRKIAGRMSQTCAHIPSGMIAVFTGCDAAGKLMAAEALAYEMQRTLYRVDMSEIGELLTGEAHFARIRSTASAENAILMIADVDGLPGLLLQGLKDYAGLSILTTDSIPEIPTTLRTSTHYIVDFPFPSDSE